MTVTASTLRIGTRASRLARAQSQAVGERLAASTGARVELVDVTTRGDVDTAPLAVIGGQGVFVSAVRAALLAGDVDVCVHSLKDLPTAPAEGVELAAVPVREDPRDAVVGRDGLTLAELPTGARIGTGSPRRAAQLRALGLGLDVVDLRGNVETRMRRVRGRGPEGDLDAVVLARAGLARLGRLADITEVLDPLQMLPAPGQGALAVECRAGDPVGSDIRAALDDADSRAAVTAERALLAAVEAGCSAPVGALAEVAWTAGGTDDDHDAAGDADDTDELWLRAVVVAPAGSPQLRHSATGPTTDPRTVGHQLAAHLLDEGAADLIGAARAGAP
ncbi:MAG: porphobilinogen deaminase [Nocardioidaceae bacterium]|jgi:hydroxymethylbilane synthase|nr:porphobilinogen deaminase [Nocardioidaceae bacterium]